MLAKFPTAPEIFPASTPAANLETFNIALLSLYQVASLRPKVVGSASPRGSAHHDGELVLPRPLCNDVSEATQILTDDIIGLLVEVAVGRIHHIGRGQATVHPALLASVSETARVKATTSWRVSCSISKIRSMSKPAF